MAYPTLDVRGRSDKDRVRPGDFKTAIWTQYLNCINSENTLETDSDSRGAQGLQFASMETHVSKEKFACNVDILESMLHGYGYLPTLEGPKQSWTDYQHKFSTLTKLMKEKVFEERAMDLGTI